MKINFRSNIFFGMFFIMTQCEGYHGCDIGVFNVGRISANLILKLD